MKKYATRILAWVSFLPILTCCNVYAPLSTVNTDEDYREQAESCLQQSDYSCAISNYNKLSDPTEKGQDLCTVDMSQAGMSLSALVNVVTNQSTGTQLLGALAQQLIPWGTTKAAAATSAVTQCNGIPNNSNSASLNNFLQVLSLILDCSTRMAKTDQYVAVSDSDTTCDTPGNNNGLIEAVDISVDPSGGPLSSSSPGMCTTDVTACVNDISEAAVLTNALQDAGLGDLAGNLVPVAAALDSLNGDAAREALRSFTIH
jgi:hypothetical protein